MGLAQEELEVCRYIRDTDDSNYASFVIKIKPIAQKES